MENVSVTPSFTGPRLPDPTNLLRVARGYDWQEPRGYGTLWAPRPPPAGLGQPQALRAFVRRHVGI